MPWPQELASGRARGEVLRLPVAPQVPQQAWVLNESVRSNITFGSPFDAAKYAAVVACCALQEDLDQLHAGDATEVSP